MQNFDKILIFSRKSENAPKLRHTQIRDPPESGLPKIRGGHPEGGVIQSDQWNSIQFYPPLGTFWISYRGGGKSERFGIPHDGMTSGARRRRENFEKTPIFIGFRLRNRIISHRAHSKFDKKGAQIYARARIQDIMSSNPRISYQGGG